MYAQQAQYLHSQGVLFMNKIKDFFYNKNDIIIVLIILIAAGLIITPASVRSWIIRKHWRSRMRKHKQTTQASEIKGNDCCSIQRIQCSRNCWNHHIGLWRLGCGRHKALSGRSGELWYRISKLHQQYGQGKFSEIRDIPDPQGFHGRTDPEHHC